MPDLQRSTYDKAAFMELVKVLDEIDHFLMFTKNDGLRQDLYFARVNMKYWDTESVEPIDLGEVCDA